MIKLMDNNALEKLIDKNRYEFCIVNDFPMFEYDDQNEKWEFCHNPFSMPQGGMPGMM